MEEKKNKNLVSIVIILLSIIILMTIYIVYNVINNSNNNLSKNNIVDIPNNNDLPGNKDTEEENFDLEKAKQLLENIEYTSFFEMPEDIEINSIKLQIAFNKAKSQSVTCDSIYANLSNAQKHDFGYAVTLEDGIQETMCQGSTKVTLYSELDDTYRNLFDSGFSISKKDIKGFSYCDGNYDYIETLDAYVHLNDSTDGCYSQNKEVNIVKTAKVKENKLIIEISNIVLEWNGQGGYDVTLGDKKITFEQSKVEKETFDNTFFSQYSQYMKVYKFIFDIEDDNYIFKGVNKN